MATTARHHHGSRRTFGRRAMLQLAGGAASGAILAACGGEAPAPTATAAPTAAMRATVAATLAATTTTAAAAPTMAAATVAPTSGMTTAATSASTVAVSATTVATAAATAAPTMAAMPAATPRSVGVMVAATNTPMAEGYIPSPAPGVPDGWTKPPTPFKSVTGPVGRGGPFTSLMGTTAPPIVPRDQNDYWKELERRMNVRWEAQLVPAGTFEERFTALVASNSLPDIVALGPPPGFGRLVQQGAFTDLTPFVTGDALKEYPNLALYDARLWKNATYFRKIYGVPRPRYFVGSVLLFRQDWAEKVGFAQIRNAEDFFNCLVAFAKGDPDGNGQGDTWGLTTTSPRPNFAIPHFNGMYRGANNWRRNPDGTLTKDIETEEYKQAVAFARRLWEAGAYHPNAATMTINDAWNAYIGGKVGAYMDDQTSVSYSDRTRPAARLLAMTATAKTVGLTPFGHDGGKATYSLTPGSATFATMPARVGRDPERVKELLRVLNFLGGPFGSEEWRMLQYGLEGIHHTLQANGIIVRTDKGEAEKNDLPNLTSAPRPFYSPDVPGPEPVRFLQKVHQEHLAIGIDDPTIGLYSATADSRGNELTLLQADRTVAVVTGREPFSAWAGFVRDWRSRGGDMIRKEFEAELKA